jgi:hypothetical protein
MASILKQYIEEARRQTKEIRSGKLSNTGIHQLKKKGMIKSEEEYTKGYEKGTDNILKKHKAKSKTGGWLTNNVFGPHFNNRTKKVRMPDVNSRFSKVYGEKDYEKDKPILKRHEAYEASDKTKKNGQIILTKSGRLSGTHNSPKVLEKEKKDVDYTSRVYNQGDRLKNIRSNSGEYDWLGKLSKRKKRELAHSNRAYHADIEKPELSTKYDSKKQKTKMLKSIGSELYDKIKSKFKKKSK